VIHLFKLYRALGWHEGMYPQAERVGAGILTLPLFPAMVNQDVERVCEALADCIRAQRDARRAA
jgi:dTDP-4-amino-4,6-dideoxygalactose transaminase